MQRYVGAEYRSEIAPQRRHVDGLAPRVQGRRNGHERRAQAHGGFPDQTDGPGRPAAMDAHDAQSRPDIAPERDEDVVAPRRLIARSPREVERAILAARSSHEDGVARQTTVSAQRGFRIVQGARRRRETRVVGARPVRIDIAASPCIAEDHEPGRRDAHDPGADAGDQQVPAPPVHDGVVLLPDARKARDQPPLRTKRGKVMNCSAKMRLTTSPGPVKGAGGSGSIPWPRPSAANAAAAIATPPTAPTHDRIASDTSAPMIARSNTGTATM